MDGAGEPAADERHGKSLLRYADPHHFAWEYKGQRADQPTSISNTPVASIKGLHLAGLDERFA